MLVKGIKIVHETEADDNFQQNSPMELIFLASKGRLQLKILVVFTTKV